MSKIPAQQIVEDIRSGLEDHQLMGKYGLSLKRLQRLLKRLVNDHLIDHKELYQKSAVYRSIADLLASRTSPRLSVPIAIRVYRHDTGEKGYVRDISDHGVRVAGIHANGGDKVLLNLPMVELNGIPPLQFEAVCRWARMEGKTMKYPVGGFEITNISEETLIQFYEMRDLILSQTYEDEQRLYRPLNVPEILKAASEMRAKGGARNFSGSVDNVDILDLVQFMLLIRKRAVLYIHSSLGDKGRLYLDDGRIVHAVKGETQGRQAFIECMNFQGGLFSTKPWHEPTERSINLPGDFLVMEAARMRDEPFEESEQEEGEN